MKHQFWKLSIWKRSVDLATSIYLQTQTFPKEEKYGLTSQIRRAAVSISSNIAEGSSRNTDKHFDHFLTLSKGSLYEVQTQLTIALKLNYISEEKHSILVDELIQISNMIYKFKSNLQL